MKKHLLSAIAAAMLCATAAYADGGRTVFMVITNTGGTHLATIELSNKADFKGPVIDRSDSTITFNGRKYPLSHIGEIRFTYGAQTGISTVSADAERAVPQGVYNLQGVRVADKLGAGLPKGIYIVNGRKVVIK